MVTEIRAAVTPSGFDLRNVRTSSLQLLVRQTYLCHLPKTLILSAESIRTTQIYEIYFFIHMLQKRKKKNTLAFRTSITRGVPRQPVAVAGRFLGFDMCESLSS